MKIVIPGGSGQVGRVISRYFHERGHTVTVLSRSPIPAPWGVVAWDGVSPGPWTSELERVDVCINLAGRSVNCRYTKANRNEIYESRIASTRLLNDVISSLRNPPLLWINASTATIYRHALDRAMTEADGEIGGHEPGAPDTWNFSIQVAKGWEDAFFAKPTLRTRRIAIRSAITLSPSRGGAFDILLRLVRWGLGGKHGSGTQYVSWIHEADFVRALEFLIDHDELSGVVNVAAPTPVRNDDFLRALRNAWGTRLALPSPAWLVEIGAFFMRTESELVLKSRRVVPEQLLKAGFRFRFPEWPEAARDLVRRWQYSGLGERDTLT